MKAIFVLVFIFSSSLASAIGPVPHVNPLTSLRSSNKNFIEDDLFEGIVKLSNCSGALVTLKGMPKTKKALVMTNGHCVGSLRMGEVKVNVPVTRSFGVFDAQKKLHELKSSRIVYSTMTHTDVTFYETTMTYQEIEDNYNVEALILEDELTRVGQDIVVVSGYWEIFTSCFAEAIAPILKEYVWVWKDSVRYSANCETKGGYSGSPVIAKNTRSVVAIHNTGNNGQFDCSNNNPCEADENGEVIFRIANRRYAQQVYQIYDCMNHDYDLDLGQQTCQLPK